MNFKQGYQYVILDGLNIHPIGEYALKLCFCLFNKKTCALLISFLYILCMEAHAYMGYTKFKCESLGNYCEFVKLWMHGSVVISAQYT